MSDKIKEVDLRFLRHWAGKTQNQVSAEMGIAQSQLSRLERRDDHLVSTLSRYVSAIGGELELYARLDGRLFKIRRHNSDS